MEHGRSCPCKKLPIRLSTITAAEYGDLHTLLARAGCDGSTCISNGSLASLATRPDSAGNTALHIAAQHGHVAVVALILSSSNGGGESIVNVAAGGATPLHRACFAGATATMRLLLQVSNCDLLAQDTSFGDLQTPLHKAASGGRVLAVQLMLEALQQRSSDVTASLLETALMAQDSLGRTPLQIAQEKQKHQESERQSVARWDTVADGKGDWFRCGQLLEQSQIQSSAGRSIVSSAMKEPIPASSDIPILCNDPECQDTRDGACLTSSWERAFRTALLNNVNATVKSNDASSARLERDDRPLNETVATMVSPNTEKNDTPTLLECQARPEAPVGHPCHDCRVVQVVLYSRGDRLVCKSCRQRVT